MNCERRTFSARYALLAIGFLASLLAGEIRAQNLDNVLTNGLVEPHSVAINPVTGNYYITDGGGLLAGFPAAHQVLLFRPTEEILTPLAGDFSGRLGTNTGTGFSARFFNPADIIQTRDGLVVADSGNNAIRYVGFDGTVTNIVGLPGTPGFVDGVGLAARFNTPLGLALNAAGEIFVADSQNNAIRKIALDDTVTTYSSAGFNQPNDVAIGANGEIWVADTRNHQIKVILPNNPAPNGDVVVRAGQGVAGFADAFPDARNALLSSPRSILWMGDQAGLLVADTGNHVIRRLFTNVSAGTYQIETSVGEAGEPGFASGETNNARLSAPLGLVTDVVGGAFLVVDSQNKALRRIQQSAPSPPVTDPRIGFVTLEVDPLTGSTRTVLNDVVDRIFNNDIVIAIKGDQGVDNLYEVAPTPTNVFVDTVPDPSASSTSAPFFQEGETALPETIIPTLVQDMTIKAQSSAPGRVASQIVKSRFQFRVANPSFSSDNAASFQLTSITTDAQLFYTIDGTEPTNGPPSLGPVSPGTNLSLVIVGTNDLVMKVVGYKPGFKPSAIVSNAFSATNFVANRMSFGFEGGSASSEFVAASGSTFYAPIGMSLLDDQTIFSLQFGLTVTNDTGPAVVPGGVGYESRLREALPSGLFREIPPAMFTGFITLATNIGTNTFNLNFPVFTNLLVTNPGINFLSVGYLERRRGTNLFDSGEQHLVQFSLAHDVLFDSAGGRAVVGSFQVQIPGTATNGQQYRVKIERPSATSDGIFEDIFIDTPTNGALIGPSPISSIKLVTVGSPKYLVGDAVPFRWWNAGDFGDTNLLNNDLIQVFQTAVYTLNAPPNGSDFRDAMDSCCGSAVVDGATGHLVPSGAQISTATIAQGTDTAINSAVFGDGTLDVNDILVTFRRSLDPTLNHYLRFRSNGFHYAVPTPNLFRGQTSSVPTVPIPVSGRQIAGAVAPPAGETPSISFFADHIVGGAGETVTVPIRATVRGSASLSALALNILVDVIDSSGPNITQQVSFNSTLLGAPFVSASAVPQNIAMSWFNPGIGAVRGEIVVGQLTVTLPAGATAATAYSVRFDHVSMSGLEILEQQTVNGLITLNNADASSLGDLIPDSWRLQHFGTLALGNNLLIHNAADADGDSFLNWQEFLAGTNPNDPNSVLKVLSERVFGAGGALESLNLKWPGQPGKTYVIEYVTSLGDTNWVPLSTNTVVNGQTIEFTSSPGMDPRFYRVRLLD
jgi:sugar lactone lactonase YvrE